MNFSSGVYRSKNQKILSFPLTIPCDKLFGDKFKSSFDGSKLINAQIITAGINRIPANTVSGHLK